MIHRLKKVTELEGEYTGKAITRTGLVSLKHKIHHKEKVHKFIFEM